MSLLSWNNSNPCPLREEAKEGGKVSDDLIKEDSYCHTCRFAGILRQRAMFYKGIRGDDKPLYECFSHWRLIEPVPTYHLVKSIDGQEVSRVEVSGEKAKELGE